MTTTEERVQAVRELRSRSDVKAALKELDGIYKEVRTDYVMLKEQILENVKGKKEIRDIRKDLLAKLRSQK